MAIAAFAAATSPSHRVMAVAQAVRSLDEPITVAVEELVGVRSTPSRRLPGSVATAADTAFVPRASGYCHTAHMRATVVLGVQGRLVVPAEARRELGLSAEDEPVLHTEDGRLVLERREDAARHLRGRFASSATRGALDELLTERRQAAASE